MNNILLLWQVAQEVGDISPRADKSEMRQQIVRRLRIADVEKRMDEVVAGQDQVKRKALVITRSIFL
jgi:hypothetical protein